MATTFESTTTRARRMSFGCPCATAVAGRMAGEPTLEWLYDRTDWPTSAVTSLPLPPVNAVAEALDDLAFGAADPSIYLEARAQLAAGVPVAFDGTTRWIDDVAVEIAPEGLRWPWPWCCACKAGRCWHGALCDGLVLAELRFADNADDPSVEKSPHRRPSYTTLLLVSSVSLLILWYVPFPVPEQSPLQALGSAASVLLTGRSSGDGGYLR